MAYVLGILAVLRRWGQLFGPYLMLEILLPGGTLLALLLFLYRRRTAVAVPTNVAKGFERARGRIER